jgi:hypothetical protein
MAGSAKTRTAKPDSDLDTSELKARALAQCQTFIEQVDSVERMTVGTWFRIDGGAMPEELAKGHFIRCGLANDDRARALEARMKRMGYVTPPRWVRCVGYETDQDGGVYLWAPREVYGALRARRTTAKRRMEAIMKETVRELQGIKGLEVEVTDRVGHGSIEDIRAAQREVRRS